MNHLENTPFPAFIADGELKITAVNRLAGAVRCGAPLETLTDEKGVSAVKTLGVGESAVICCRLDPPMTAIATRISENEYFVRANVLATALMKHAENLRGLGRASFGELCRMSGKNVIPSYEMPRFRRAVFLQRQLNEYVCRVLDVMSEKFAPVDFSAVVKSLVSAASAALEGTGAGVIATGDLSPCPVLASRRDLAYMLLSCAALCFAELKGRLVEIRVKKSGHFATACIMCAVKDGSRTAELMNAVPDARAEQIAENEDALLIASHARLLCELNGGTLSAFSEKDTLHINAAFETFRDDTLSLCAPPAADKELCRFASELFAVFCGTETEMFTES